MKRMSAHHLVNLIALKRSVIRDRNLGYYLAFIAGAINAGGFLAIGTYTSHMTGLLSAIGDDFVVGAGLSAFSGLMLVATFILGAATTAILVNWGLRHQLQSSYALPLLLEALVLLAFGLTGANIEVYTALTIPLIALMLCFLMGLQNAMITKISNAVIRTTHMTGVATDIGIELGRLLYWNRDPKANNQRYVQANRPKLRMHCTLLVLFTLGGVVGALSFKFIGYVSVLPIAASMVALSLPSVYSDWRLSKVA
jgi:uncharacterized membrane protein YoaK (UPF0700 family)